MRGYTGQAPKWVEHEGGLGHDEIVNLPSHQIRALYTADTITVCQAYAPEIALPAVAAGRFVAPFKRERMTWIKPSFLWMMYRSGWASRPGQECVLAVEIRRDGFEWALANSCLSHYDRGRHQDRSAWSRALKASPVRVQWDPERTLRMQLLAHRSLQIGLSGVAVDAYVDEWIVSITDVTAVAHEIDELIHSGNPEAATTLLTDERPYPLASDVAAVIGANG
jgi:hypothetical protein